MYSFPFDASDADGSSGAAVYESNGDDDTLILDLAGRKLAAAAACCLLLSMSSYRIQRGDLSRVRPATTIISKSLLSKER